jgi:hypothetical protein
MQGFKNSNISTIKQLETFIRRQEESLKKVNIRNLNRQKKKKYNYYFTILLN